MIRRTKLTFDAQRWKAEEALAREGVSIMVCAGTGCVVRRVAMDSVPRRCTGLCMEERGLPVAVESCRGARTTTRSASRKAAATASARWARWCASSPMGCHVHQGQALRTARKSSKRPSSGGRGRSSAWLYRARTARRTTTQRRYSLLFEAAAADSPGTAVSPIARIVWEYIAKGGYSAFEKALFEMTADADLHGGHFLRPARARRRRLPHRQKVGQRAPSGFSGASYIVCNGDEGDPGAFMDQSIMEGNPHSHARGHDDRRDRASVPTAVISTSARSILWRSSACRRPSIRRDDARSSRREHPRHGLLLSISASTAARARSSAARAAR